DDLLEAWRDDCYEGKFPQLLKLMERFELAFPLSDEPNTYIAPLLLPEDQPKYVWSKQYSLQLRYNYDFMPKGIFSRLMVRLHHLIKEHLFWKRGMVLRRSNTEAEVREEYEGRNLFISVKGKEAREMIYEIGSEIDRINSTFHFSERMRVIKQVPCNCDDCKNTSNPHFYEYQTLLRRLEVLKKTTIECPNSGIDVSVKNLLHDVGLDGTVGGNKPHKYQQAIGLVTRHEFPQAFDLLDTLDLQNSLYYQLKNEYTSGVSQNGVQYADRLITFLKTLQ
ncbi:MAG TPA: COR domain-containing protein, partial [Chitinophagales bacterium]|nr:COR domain-containing protein [Chitinophagales bacterium]